jgi:hypothetical protein
MFVLCPRCELNYIEEEEEYCKICKAELGLIDPSTVFMPEDDDVSEGKLCPICKINYIEDDEEMCLMCKREKEEKIAAEKAEEESINNWRDEEVPTDDEEMEISLSDLEEEEEEEEEKTTKNKDDDDFNYDVDPNDFIGDDEEDEEEVDEEDDF